MPQTTCVVLRSYEAALRCGNGNTPVNSQSNGEKETARDGQKRRQETVRDE